MAESNPTIALLPDQESLARDPRALGDFSGEVSELLTRLDVLVSSSPGGLEEATEAMLVLEKKTRQVRRNCT